MAYKILTFSSDAALAKNAADDWLLALRRRKDTTRPFTVALSGGRIAKTLFSEAAAIAAAHPLTEEGRPIFENVHFFWGDERCVPPNDPESNFGAAKKLLLDPMKIPDAQIHRVRGEAPEAVALQEAVSDITRVAPVVKGQPVLDLIFLGMGEDGHVASLFPGEEDGAISSEAVYRAVTAVKPPPRRMTLGYAALVAATEVWVVASGAGKEGALKESISPTGRTPLARVLNRRAQTKILTDIMLVD